MTETYTMVGTEPSWITAFMPVPAIIVYSSLGKRKKNTSPAFGWQQAVIVAYFFICSLIGIPMEWIMGGACFAVGVVSATSLLKRNLRFGLVLAPVFAVLGIVFIMEGRIIRDQVTLTDTQANFRTMGEPMTIPRTGLNILVSQNKQWFNIRPWRTWTSHSREGPGPNFSGFFVYWGPHGLIRGDDLAAHFARWAGVVPSILTRQGKSYLHTPMPGFGGRISQ